jgi:hypothetical protein
MGGTYHVDIEGYDNLVFTYSSVMGKYETYQSKIERLAEEYPAVAEAKAHLDALMALVENGE